MDGQRARLAHLVADAVLDVPVRVAYIGTLTAAASTPSAIYVARLMNDPILLGAINAALPVFWWDPLAALAGTNPTLVDDDWLSIDVVQDEPSSGRTIESRPVCGCASACRRIRLDSSAR
ncbi:MAG TPA: hypothetical protein VEL51_22180 [Vicinamibacterales bacterium]|nr:hypothetical protein [Vicinamibacterales bacterium]